MAYSFACTACGVSLRAKPKLAGRTLKCPKCDVAIVVPSPPGDSAPPAKAPLPATDKQKEFAISLGIDFPNDIARSALSDLIDDALEKQDNARYDRLFELQQKESEVREELRAEVLAELDDEDPRVSIATGEQFIEALSFRDISAVLLILPGGDPESGRVQITSTDDLDEEDIRILLALVSSKIPPTETPLGVPQSPLDLPAIRRLKAGKLVQVIAMRQVMRSKFDKRMFLDLELSPADDQLLWLYAGPECEAMAPEQHQQLVDIIGETWDMFRGAELIDRQGNVLARSIQYPEVVT